MTNLRTDTRTQPFIVKDECKYRRLGVSCHKSTRDNPVSASTTVGVHLPGAFGATVDNSVP